MFWDLPVCPKVHEADKTLPWQSRHAVLSRVNIFLSATFLTFGTVWLGAQRRGFLWWGGVFFGLQLCAGSAVACGIYSCGMWHLVSWPGIKLGTPVLGAWSLRRWTGESQGYFRILGYLLSLAQKLCWWWCGGPECSSTFIFFQTNEVQFTGKIQQLEEST